MWQQRAKHSLAGADDNSRTVDLPFPNDIRVTVNGVRKYLSIDFASSAAAVVFINGLSEGDVVKIDPTEYNFYKHSLGVLE